MSDALSRSFVPKAKPKSKVVLNNSGGVVYQIALSERLRRFLILGTTGGTYYVTEQDHITDNIDAVDAMIDEDPTEFARIVDEVSDGGLAYSNTAAVFAVARFIIRCPEDMKGVARNLVDSVCRTSTHLFQFCGFIDSMGGWGKAKIKAVQRWYTSRTPTQLAYQAVKYRGGRYGWSHRDVLRTSHPKGLDSRVVNFILGHDVLPDTMDAITGFNRIQKASTAEDAIHVMRVYTNLPIETVPTAFRKNPGIWRTLYENGQLQGQALVRNVRNMANYGCFEDNTFAEMIAYELKDPQMIRRTRLHPMQFIYAMAACGMFADDNVWPRMGYDPYSRNVLVPRNIADALEEGFYKSFGNAQSSSRILLAVDVSASMQAHIKFGDQKRESELTCAVASVCMAMAISRNSPYSRIMGFSTNFIELNIGSKSTLSQAIKAVSGIPFGGTDCSLPMTWAMNSGVDVDAVVVITDNETNYQRGWGNSYESASSKAMMELKRYRKFVGHDVKLVVVGMTSTGFSIADPSDPSCIDFVGFDASVPQSISQFCDQRS